MKITSVDFKVIEKLLPRQRGNVSISNLQVLNAILYVAEHGCKWRGLPKKFGNWHTIYTCANRWAKQGVLDHVFACRSRKFVSRSARRQSFIMMMQATDFREDYDLSQTRRLQRSRVWAIHSQ
jgi:transposase